MILTIVGDSHNNSRFMEKAIKTAYQCKSSVVIQLGDFGFLPDDLDKSFLNNVQSYLTEYKLPLWVIRGNHDYKKKALQFVNNDLYHPSLHYIQDNTIIELDGLKCLFVGGAVSIDRFHRPAKYWYHDEKTLPLPNDFNSTVDILFSHDSCDVIPGRSRLSFGPIIDADLYLQRNIMTSIYETTKPRYHYHGHWHQTYSTYLNHGKVIGLSHESEDSILVIDTKLLKE